MERVHLDVLGPFTPSESGKKYVLMMIDQFSKWVECSAIPEQSTETVVQEFFTLFVTTFGCEIKVHTDQGTNLNQISLDHNCSAMGMAKTRSSPYRLSSKRSDRKTKQDHFTNN